MLQVAEIWLPKTFAVIGEGLLSGMQLMGFKLTADQNQFFNFIHYGHLKNLKLKRSN